MSMLDPALQRLATYPVVRSHPEDREVAAQDHAIEGRAVDAQDSTYLLEGQDFAALFLLVHKRRDF